MTEVNLDTIFSSLESSAAEFNSTSDLGNQTLIDAEKRLVTANIGIEVWYPEPLESTDAEGDIGPLDVSSYIVDILGFARTKGKWCLVIKRIKRVSGFFEGDMNRPYTNEYLETPPVPLLKRSRSLRIKALAALPEFLAQITKDIRSKTFELSEATHKLKN
ncbi:MAG: hypothetical protein GY770_07015 [Aestuariibacter sp.]|nr:hypothetical protein [Aestuariibacter sp.]